jgi:hypothetical protein
MALPDVTGECPWDGKRKFVWLWIKAQALCALFGSEDMVILWNSIPGTCQGRSPLSQERHVCGLRKEDYEKGSELEW